MCKRKCIAIATTLIIFLFLFSCSDRETPVKTFLPHIGEWSGAEAKLVFREDGKGFIRLTNQVSQFDYVFDYSKDPVWLDLVYPSEGKPFRARLIVKFLGNNKMKIRTFFNQYRPKEFAVEDMGNTLFLNRVNPVGAT